MKTVFLLCCAVAVVLAVAYLRAPAPFDPSVLPPPVTDADYYDQGAPPPAKVELGRLLFFDKILSGNQNISCATCHHPELATADAVALGLGEGARGLGLLRRTGATLPEGVHERVPRNAPALFNLGTHEYIRMFHDGRVEVDTLGYYHGGFITPAKWKLPPGLDNVLAAQALFPVTSPTEMAGQKGENPIADARALNNVAGPGGVWAQLAARLQAIPAYVDHFQVAFPDEVAEASDISMVLAANAIAAFEATAFRADQSPFDHYLRTGEGLSDEALRGLQLFYGDAQCATCHAGPFQTDHDFYAIAMPQIGPGKAHGADGSYWRATGQKAFLEDWGRGRVTGRDEDRFKFRTPSLRNVTHTGPWGHAGAYATLEAVVRHHLDPVAALEAYDPEAVTLPPLDHLLELTADGPQLHYRWYEGPRLAAFAERDTWVQRQVPLRDPIAVANQLAPRVLSERDLQALLAFLESLTDPSVDHLAALIPAAVPSGLPVSD